ATVRRLKNPRKMSKSSASGKKCSVWREKFEPASAADAGHPRKNNQTGSIGSHDTGSGWLLHCCPADPATPRAWLGTTCRRVDRRQVSWDSRSERTAIYITALPCIGSLPRTGRNPRISGGRPCPETGQGTVGDTYAPGGHSDCDGECGSDRRIPSERRALSSGQKF